MQENFNDANEYVERSEKHLIEAQRLQEHNKKASLWIAVVICVVLLILFCFLFGVF